MRKRILSKLLICCLVLALASALAACGGNNATTTEQATEVAETTKETLVPSELLGTLTETSYINETFGLRYDVQDDWYILSRDETAEVIGIVTDSVTEESLVEMFESRGYVTDFYAMQSTPAFFGAASYNNVNITIQDIGKLYGTILDEKKLAEASVQSVKDTLENLGLSDITMDVGETEFIGKTCVASMLTGKTGGTNMYQKQVYLKKGAAVACVTATTFGEDKTDEVLSAFSDSVAESDAAEKDSSEATTAKAAANNGAAANADAISDASLSSGSISIDGDMFTLGTSCADVMDNGWSLTDEDLAKYKDSTLDPMTTSGIALDVYKAAYGYEFSSFHVMVSLMNESNTQIPYLEGTIDHLSVSGIARFDSVAPIIFPGGLTMDSTAEDFIAAYGEPTYEYEDSEMQMHTLEFEDGDVELQILWYKGSIDEITLMR